MLAGIYFDPKSEFAKLCEGVDCSKIPNQVIPHTHELKNRPVDKSRVLNSSTDNYYYLIFFLCQLF